MPWSRNPYFILSLSKGGEVLTCERAVGMAWRNFRVYSNDKLLGILGVSGERCRTILAMQSQKF